MAHGEERREFQRLVIDPPIAASLAGARVFLIEIGVLGARVKHSETLSRNATELRFDEEGRPVALRCEVVRTAESPDGGFESGLRFVAAVGESGDHLRSMLARLANKALESRRVPASLPIERSVDGDKTIRGKDAGYVCHRIENGVWRKRAVFLPEQPAVGFTVARGLDDDELQRLQRVYMASDDEGRRLIRLFAELSVSEALEIPPRV
jgi:hypothetical protein